MLLNKLKQFHQQTMERYRDEENMEPWKKAVMEIHEKATFRENTVINENQGNFADASDCRYQKESGFASG